MRSQRLLCVSQRLLQRLTLHLLLLLQRLLHTMNQLMAWRSQGMLTDAEFALAEERILGI